MYENFKAFLIAIIWIFMMLKQLKIMYCLCFAVIAIIWIFLMLKPLKNLYCLCFAVIAIIWILMMLKSLKMLYCLCFAVLHYIKICSHNGNIIISIIISILDNAPLVNQNFRIQHCFHIHSFMHVLKCVVCIAKCFSKNWRKLLHALLDLHWRGIVPCCILSYFY